MCQLAFLWVGIEASIIVAFSVPWFIPLRFRIMPVRLFWARYILGHCRKNAATVH